MTVERPPGAASFGYSISVGPEVQSNRVIGISLPNVTVPEGMNVIYASIVDLLPWFSPSVVATVGGPGLPGDGGLQVLVTYEWPVPYFNSVTLLPKPDLESLHVARFQCDVQLASGDLPFTVLGRGDEPPDFIVSGARDRELGLECTVLADSNRRTVEGLFSRIRQRLIQESRVGWKHLAGHVIVAWFVKEDSLVPDQLPHRFSDDKAIEALVEKIKGLRPGRTGDPLGQPSDYAQRLQEMGVVTSGFGCLFYILPMHEAVPTTDFFTRTGFELACLYESLHTATTIIKEIDRLVHQHDKPGVDWLLITVSGPRRDGLSHPTEMAFANAFIHSGLPVARPRHIRRVLLHFFPTGGCFEAFPRRRWYVEHQYAGGLIVAHHKRLEPGPGRV